MKASFNKVSLLDFILLLRIVSISIQVSLLYFVQVILKYELPWLPLVSIIAVEVIFNFFCYALPRIKQNASRKHIFIQLLADVIFLGCLLFFSGGATNAFVSLLLIPIAIAGVCLPIGLLSLITLAAMTTYSYLLYIMPMHVMHGNMEGHFIAMWLNFIFSAMVVSVVISRMAKAINANKLVMARYREEQLKQEQMIALGVASTQVSHDLATPISSIRILLDELQDELTEQGKENTDISEILTTLNTQVSRCSTNLTSFRHSTIDIKNNTQKPYLIIDLLAQIKHYCHLAYPQHQLSFIAGEHLQKSHAIWGDNSLQPALINVIDNAVKYSHDNNSHVNVYYDCSENTFQIKVIDSGKGFASQALFQQITKSSRQTKVNECDTAEQNNKVPRKAVDNQEGLGIALFLSNSTIERLKGNIEILNLPEGGAQVCITFPLYPLNLK